MGIGMWYFLGLLRPQKFVNSLSSHQESSSRGALLLSQQFGIKIKRKKQSFLVALFNFLQSMHKHQLDKIPLGIGRLFFYFFYNSYTKFLQYYLCWTYAFTIRDKIDNSYIKQFKYIIFLPLLLYKSLVLFVTDKLFWHFSLSVLCVCKLND